MTTEQLIYKIMKSNSQTWVRYFIVKELSGITRPGEYLEIRTAWLGEETLSPLLEAGFKIEKITSQKINADSFCDVLLKRDLNA